MLKAFFFFSLQSSEDTKSTFAENSRLHNLLNNPFYLISCSILKITVRLLHAKADAPTCRGHMASFKNQGDSRRLTLFSGYSKTVKFLRTVSALRPLKTSSLREKEKNHKVQPLVTLKQDQQFSEHLRTFHAFIHLQKGPNIHSNSNTKKKSSAHSNHSSGDRHQRPISLLLIHCHLPDVIHS